ncbi:hypothetical protein LMG16407_00106 [Pandoraea apista]|nr:hypothetical protein LMG16407_00106 [Pandoraea apista]
MNVQSRFSRARRRRDRHTPRLDRRSDDVLLNDHWEVSGSEADLGRSSLRCDSRGRRPTSRSHAATRLSAHEYRLTGARSRSLPARTQRPACMPNDTTSRQRHQGPRTPLPSKGRATPATRDTFTRDTDERLPSGLRPADPPQRAPIRARAISSVVRLITAPTIRYSPGASLLPDAAISHATANGVKPPKIVVPRL